MRRAAIAVVVCVVGGYAFGGIEHEPAGLADMLTASHRPATRAKTVPRAAVAGTKTVEYAGYELSVPASWPVYRLAEDPSQCVRYDVHALYLGTPGPDQNCPAGLVGRTETVSIGSPAPGRRPAIVGQRVALRGDPANAERLVQNVGQREIGVAMPAAASAAPITATYGADPGVVERVLASIHEVIPQSARPAPAQVPAPTSTAASASASAQPTRRPLAVQPSPEDAGLRPDSALRPGSARPSAKATPKPSGTPAATASAAAEAVDPAPVPPAASPGPAATEPMPGFDTCTAPSLRAMRAWRAKFAATAIYIGGEEMACDYGNLSTEWIKAAEAMGWSLLPTYVGPQASCNAFSGEIDPKDAAAEGRAAAVDAVADAEMFGLGKGTPVYYDMEAYDNSDARCVMGVLTFLDAWTRQLNADGYVSGVYSSADSGIIDLDTISSVDRHSLAEPQQLWFALWDDSNNLNGEPYLTVPLWPPAHRSKQYAGSERVKIHGFALDVDLDLVDSAVVR
ncbi:MAG TPA: glycoside hydrolase domain-containing protein [Streptosporangiaceae bacterium]|nr:glycoside hydrolase domain-containing protein [Streptosporangiaceae bacterium]